MSFYWPAKPILTEAECFGHIILQVNKNSYSLLQKSVIVYYCLLVQHAAETLLSKHICKEHEVAYTFVTRRTDNTMAEKD
jgi:hypothetical protein